MASLSVKLPTSFSILAGEGKLPPLSLRMGRNGDLFELGASPVRLVEIADLLAAASGKICVLFDVEHQLVDPTNRQRLRLSDLRRLANVQMAELGPSRLLTHSKDLPAIAAVLVQEGCRLVDAPDPSAPTRWAPIFEEVSYKPIASLVPRLPGARWFVDSADDRHVRLESGEPALPRAIAARMLALLAATLLLQGDTKRAAQLDEPPESLVATLLDGGEVVIRADAATREREDLRIPYGTKSSIRWRRSGWSLD